ncbi:DNA repair protein RAD50 [Drosophila busckii]|uniref:DNA repair protein RAD50 n=1 Tax=Drosophila busckii TaxID=30019 RepID=UPI00083F1C64|nr:DNA repair protein RAD50 [Drosophila busckii]
MSTIEKLSIQGVRSFGPNSEDVQSITFASPITLILGQNGCGKTTIIECLKFALTGEYPPGSDRGKSFVHDPKIFGRNESLAQIKMQVRDKIGARLSICRSMKVSIRRDKTNFETIDTTINFLDSSDGKVKGRNHESLSLRGANADLAVTDFMGVSKAIINNVLFCHQEDSSWPLDEPKKLKGRFDAIFGITEYNKALDKIIKMRKEAMEELKVMEANMKLLSHLKEEMEAKTLSLQKEEQKCQKLKEQCEQCDEEVKPVDARLLEIRKIEYEIGKYQSQKVEMDTKHKNCLEQIAKLKNHIKELFPGTMSELELEIRSFDQRMSEMRFQRDDMNEQLIKLKQSNTDCQKTLTAQDKKRSMALQQLENEKECKSQLSKRINNLCEQLQIDVVGNPVDNAENLKSLLHDIEDMLMSKQCEITELSAQNDQAEQSRQTKIDELRTEVTKSEQSVVSQEKQKQDSERESDTLEIKIKQIETSLHQLKVLEKQIADTDEKFERATRAFNKEAIREALMTKKNDIAKKQKRFKELDEQLTKLNSITQLMAEINLKEKELEKKTQEIKRVRSKHSDNFGKFIKEPITNNYRRTVQNTYDKLRREIQELNESANALKLKEQSHNIKRSNLVADISRMEKEQREFQEQVYEKCHSTPYDELLLRSKTAISKHQLEHGALISAEAMYKKYIQKINEDPNCPLCHHNMSGDEACDLTTELTDEIQKLPDNISRAEKALKAEQLKYDNLLQIKPTIDKVKELEESLPQKREELQKIEKLRSETAVEHETIIALLGEPTSNMELAYGMLNDMTLLDEALKESGRVTKELENLKLKLPADYDSNVSAEALQAEKTAVSKEVEAESELLESNQKAYDEQTEALNRLREFRNGLKDKRIQLQDGVQSLPQLKERLDELTKLLITVTREIAELKAKIQPLKHNLSAAIAEKARLKEIERQKLAELNKKFNEYKSTDQDIQRLKKQAQDFAKLKLAAEISSLDATIKATKEQLSKLDSEITSSSDKLEKLKTDCHNQQTRERDLKDNRELKQMEQKEAELNENCQALGKQLGNLDFRSVTKEKNELITKKDAASMRRGELLGQLGEINNQLTKLKREIEDPKYKKSLHNYRRAHFEVYVQRCGIDDLGQHRVALEWALIQFHAEKMNNINSLIREYWRMIYRGNDIDYVQIKTDEIAQESSADRRKSYNYRVVQSKNNSEIEMRGRCSAGQRVLASLIIRMALAETFSANCGVLALDEPTTNLDRDNIISLCDALNRVVENRQSMANFMLIIITHDEYFISSLGRITNYHRVLRNSECKSCIQKVRVDDK